MQSNVSEMYCDRNMRLHFVNLTFVLMGSGGHSFSYRAFDKVLRRERVRGGWHAHIPLNIISHLFIRYQVAIIADIL
jgi:hypothetical protein